LGLLLAHAVAQGSGLAGRWSQSVQVHGHKGAGDNLIALGRRRPRSRVHVHRGSVLVLSPPCERPGSHAHREPQRRNHTA
jgi:hypothetical protein